MTSLVRSMLLFSGLLVTLTFVPFSSVLAAGPVHSTARPAGAADSYRLYMLLRKHPHLVRKHPALARELEFTLAKAALPPKSAPTTALKSERGRDVPATAENPQTGTDSKAALVADAKTAE